MKPPLVFLFCLLLLASLALVQVGSGSPSAFVIERADASKTLATAPDAGLNTLIVQVAPRFKLEYANALKFTRLAAPAAELLNLIGGVSSRIVLQYANANRFYTVSYPAEMIDDHSAPIIRNFQISSSGNVRWETDEYTRSELRVGSSPGSYTQTYQSSLYAKVHQYTLSGLNPGKTYYARLKNTDRSGNTVQSSELTFRLQQNLYLPMTRKQ